MSVQLQTQTKTAQRLSFLPVQTGLLQRKCACGQHTIAGAECEECRQKREGMIQRAAVDSAPVNSVPPIVHEVLSSPGQSLDAGTRAFMEPLFGYDFSSVRVHIDRQAAQSAQAVNALAYTVGRDVVFRTGQYVPGTIEGKRLLAHELTHVVQQRSSATQVRTKIGQPRDVYEQEADRMAEQVAQPQAYPSERPGMSTTKDTQGVVRLKLAPAPPVPEWYQLPDLAQTDLMARGYTQAWFEGKPPEVRLTVLNLYVKLKGMSLWDFVGSEHSTGLGTLVFANPNIDDFKKTLTDREDFTSPEKSEEEWSSREMRVSGQLHFKHFKGWPKTVVEAHIDQHGLLMRSKWWWIIFPVPLVEMGIHALTYESYKDVQGIRDILLGQGWWPEPLKGVKSEGDYPLPITSLRTTKMV